MCWHNLVGVDYGEGPPVPISNTVVKLTGAENTWLATARENRLTPTQQKDLLRQVFFVFLAFSTRCAAAVGVVDLTGVHQSARQEDPVTAACRMGSDTYI